MTREPMQDSAPGPLRGVNLGGWLLLEKWMTPSLFADTDAADEYSLMQMPGTKEKVEKHRASFITESDFAWLHAHHINAVRIPVGYWALQSDPPFLYATQYLDWAMDMAKKYNLQVIIDLHGLKGSQNGYDHSGKVGASEWFKNATYRKETLETLKNIANRYKNHDNFWGLQIINEPKLGLFHFTLRRYYRDAYTLLSQILKPHTRIIFSDAFTSRLFSYTLPRSSHPVAMDVHHYHMTTLFSKYFSIQWFMNKTVQRGRLFAHLSKRHPIIIGEWSGVMRHETMQHIPADKQEKIIRDYITLQIRAFGATAGWFYWTYKTESPGVWNFRSQVEAGLINVSGYGTLTPKQ